MMKLLMYVAGVRYVPDTDDEFYENEASEDSDSSNDSHASDNKDNKSLATTTDSTSTQLKRRLSESEDQPAAAADSSRDCVSGDTVAVDTGQVKRLDDATHVDVKPPQSLATDCEPVDKKRRKLGDDSANEPTTSSDVNSHGM